MRREESKKKEDKTPPIKVVWLCFHSPMSCEMSHAHKVTGKFFFLVELSCAKTCGERTERLAGSLISPSPVPGRWAPRRHYRPLCRLRHCTSRARDVSQSDTAAAAAQKSKCQGRIFLFVARPRPRPYHPVKKTWFSV